LQYQGQKVDFWGRRHISTSGFASTATEMAVFALFLGHDLINPVKMSICAYVRTSVRTYVRTSTIKLNAATNNQVVVFVRVGESFTTI